MANNRINRYVGAIAFGTLLATVSGCTDTWDDHYNSDGTAAGTTATLWDVISSNKELSKFTEIVRNAYYYKDNEHPVTTYSFEDILNGGQVNTVWVPDNDALSQAEFDYWMKMLAESKANPNSNAGFNVQQQFLGNHIALWRHNISEPGIDTVKMVNGKNLIFNKTARTLEGVSLGEYNIPTANGVLHILKGVAPFRYNLYEHLKYGDTKAKKFSDYVVGQDTTYFSQDLSIEGLPDENGRPTYVDSVYFTSNMLFESRHWNLEKSGEKWQMLMNGFAARINVEDSAFVMLMPTDNAWDATYEKLKSAYVYSPVYEDKTKGDENVTSGISIKGLNADSLQKMSIEMDMISPLVFNVNVQPKVGGQMWTLDKFAQLKGEGAQYLLNTYGDTLRQVGNWKPTELFDAVPTEMSNGLAYEVSSLNYPKEYYTPDVEVELEHIGTFYNTLGKNYKVGSSTGRVSFSNEAFKEFTSVYGEVSNNNFYFLQRQSANKGPQFEIKLKGNSPSAYVPTADVMSGTYDIQVVFVPYWYLDLSYGDTFKYYEIKYDTTYVDYKDVIDGEEVLLTDTVLKPYAVGLNYELIDSISNANQYVIKASITSTNGSKEASKELTKSIFYDGKKVDTLTIAEDFKFDYSYKNLIYSYPTLYIENIKKSTNKDHANCVYDLIIDKIILKRKD